MEKGRLRTPGLLVGELLRVCCDVASRHVRPTTQNLALRHNQQHSSPCQTPAGEHR